jgi:threonine/homoserine/homoserine lactone efflux protein
MISVSDFLIFALASLMLNLTPGSDMLYVATRSMSQGLRAGVVSAWGIMVGCMVHILAMVAGLSLLIAQSALAFQIIKYLGAIYLIYLGINALRAKKQSFTNLPEIKPATLNAIFTQGVITNVLNPKVAIFFLAFLPQFVQVDSPSFPWQILFLGFWFNFSGTIVNLLVAYTFGKLGNWLSKNSRFALIQDRISGFILILLGIRVAMLEKPQ